MSDLNERVDDVMEQIEDCISPNNIGAVKHRIRKALQEQDKITREACAEAVRDVPEFQPKILVGHAHLKVLNCQGGTK